MNPIRKTFLVFSLVSVLAAGGHDPHRVLVKLQPHVSRQEFQSAMDGQKYEIEKVVVRRLGIYLVRLKTPYLLSAREAVNDLRTNPWVESSQLDHEVTRRETIPDDPDFSDQWALNNTGQGGGTEDADIDAPEAWDITTSGVNPLGDTIVVAIVDGGMLTSHQDLAPNLWTNHAEIPGNNIDDDGNGYVDDIHGWNAYDSDGDIPNDGHGTHVGGIVSARGNNGQHVTGVNWEVQLMPIAGSSGNTSTVLEAYGYALDQRVRYDSTGGAEGAFVVATNSSFGVDFADCNSGNYILWNDMYDALGEVGILSAAATINSSANVDETGDVPTGCESEYMVAVTNTTRTDARNSGAAYGATTIDLGAPGSNILSTYSNGSTTNLTGTSMASPHVAGAVGFIHAAMTSSFAQYYQSSPAAAALEIKEMLLAGVDTLASLQGITISGGRLNLHKTGLLAAGQASADSLDPNPVSQLLADLSVDNRVVLTWIDPSHLSGGDPITSFTIDVSRDGLFLTSINQGQESFVQEFIPGETLYTYSLVTRLFENDSTSVPAVIKVTPRGEGCIFGDANHDGNITLIDVVRQIKLVMNYVETTEFDLCSGDLDFDGRLTINDVLATVDLIHSRD